MQDEVVFLPEQRGANVQHIALIAGGFFIFVQLLFLDSIEIRIAFTVVFVLFLLLGFWLANRIYANWPQKIVINRSGISYDNLKAQNGVDYIPWRDIARMDIF